MIWHYFPVGMRFPVPDFTEATKRRCWELALSALVSADPSNVKLYEAESENGIYGFGREYLCILCFAPIAQSRNCVRRFWCMPRLLAHLTLDRPFLQANALEIFGDFTHLGTTQEDGTILCENKEHELFGTRLPKSGLAVMEQTAVTLFGTSGDPAEDHRAQFGLLCRAAERNLGADRILLPNPKHGMCYAMVASTGGRFDRVPVSAADGTIHSLCAGILPNGWTVFDVPHPSVTEDDCLTALILHGYRCVLVNRISVSDLQEMQSLADRHPTLNIKFLCERAPITERLDAECWTTFVTKALHLSERLCRSEGVLLQAERIEPSLLHRSLSLVPDGMENVALISAESGNSVGNALHF